MGACPNITMMNVQSVRPAAVAGSFYAASPERLEADVDLMLGSSSAPRHHPKALIVPHAGYIYSGSVAAGAYRLLAGAPITRVVMLGPAHTVYVPDIAVPTHTHFSTPLGLVPVDHAALEEIRTRPWVVDSDDAHHDEHCLEVQLPFLQRQLPDTFSVVPLLIGDCASLQVADVLDALWGGDETVIVVSSDLSHYLTYREASTADARTANAILAQSHDLRGDEACGARAINGLMHCAAKRGLRVDELDRRNSGDTSGDKTRVVGYGAYALY